MSLQNRVNPEGKLCFSSARGTLMGNRGCLHDGNKQIVSNSKRDAWVTCLLNFQGRQRSIMEPGSYTEIFFLDEVTAFAAGHRPCATCRRERYDAFMAAWSRGNRQGVKTLAGDVDKQMKLDRAPKARVRVDSINGLPDGAMIQHGESGTYYAVRRGQLYPWGFFGYETPVSASSVKGLMTILTPACTINALNSGYVATFHSSAK